MKYLTLLGLLLVILLITGPATAATSNAAVLRPRFVAVGMPPVNNGFATLRGTLGQPLVYDVTSPPSHLCAGFWCGWPFLYQLQLPVVLRVP